MRSLRLAVFLFASGWLGAGPLLAGSALADAVALFDARRYPEARAALERLLAAEPKNAAASHYLGRAIAARGDNAALEEALKWLALAAELEPANPVYLGIYGGTSLQYAARVNSLGAATKGRDAMEKAVALDPAYVFAREGLFQFYTRAPWPLGSSSKAAAHLAEIRKRDPALATVLDVSNKVRTKDFSAAFRLCEEVLAKNPNDYTALYHYGRTASVSGQNLERGAQALKKALALEPPSPASPTHSHVWHRLGTIQEQLGRADEARTAYRTALELDPSNSSAAEALGKLR